MKKKLLLLCAALTLALTLAACSNNSGGDSKSSTPAASSDSSSSQQQGEIGDWRAEQKIVVNGNTYQFLAKSLFSEEGEVWLLRDEAEERYILKTDSAGRRDPASEFTLLNRLPPELVGRIPQAVDCFQEDGVELCRLLDQLHRMEPPVIHRDIKPENILLSPEGKPCLIDFDIARSYKAGQDSDTTFMGTRRTAAPEQYGYAQTDGRTDLYALCAGWSPAPTS